MESPDFFAIVLGVNEDALFLEFLSFDAEIVCKLDITM